MEGSQTDSLTIIRLPQATMSTMGLPINDRGLANRLPKTNWDLLFPLRVRVFPGERRTEIQHPTCRRLQHCVRDFYRLVGADSRISDGLILHGLPESGDSKVRETVVRFVPARVPKKFATDPSPMR